LEVREVNTRKRNGLVFSSCVSKIRHTGELGKKRMFMNCR
jgi:hypothetical protein